MQEGMTFEETIQNSLCIQEHFATLTNICPSLRGISQTCLRELSLSTSEHPPFHCPLGPPEVLRMRIAQFQQFYQTSLLSRDYSCGGGLTDRVWPKVHPGESRGGFTETAPACFSSPYIQSRNSLHTLMESPIFSNCFCSWSGGATVISILNVNKRIWESITLFMWHFKQHVLIFLS